MPIKIASILPAKLAFSAKDWLYVILFNTAIAVFLTVINFGAGLLTNFVFSQCIGLSMCASVKAALHLARKARPWMQLALVIFSMLPSACFGMLSATLITGHYELLLTSGDYGMLTKALLFSLLFASIISYIFVSRDQVRTAEALVQEERIRRLDHEKRVVETNLKLLQAQIEPHFLFNTLSNVLSLMETDVEKGKAMMVDLIQYLRTSLSRSREDVSTLGQEMEMIRAYLDIFKVRMGERLNYHVDVPGSLESVYLPPMLIQPLVENAVKHGLEPKIEGGEIQVRAEVQGDKLRIWIADSGNGMHDHASYGVGLENVRSRLQSLYGTQGTLTLEEHKPTGLKATIEIPYATGTSHHCRR